MRFHGGWNYKASPYQVVEHIDRCHADHSPAS